jgi:hypothetical protein
MLLTGLHKYTYHTIQLLVNKLKLGYVGSWHTAILRTEYGGTSLSQLRWFRYTNFTIFVHILTTSLSSITVNIRNPDSLEHLVSIPP